MRKLAFLFLLLASFSSLAASVKITSFVYVRNDRYLAELCGVVEGASSPSFVKLNVDFKGSRPAVYNAVAGEDGKFCQALITYRGEAEATVFGTEKKVLATIE
jgi:hypothetical protein